MKNLLFILCFMFVIIFLTFQSCTNQDNQTLKETEDIEKFDTTSYIVSGFNRLATLALISNDSFYYGTEFISCIGGSRSIKSIIGTYKQHKSSIHLSPQYIRNIEYGEIEMDTNNEILPIQPVVSYELYQRDSQAIKTTYYRLDFEEYSFLLSEEYKNEFFSEATNENDFEALAFDIKANVRFYKNYFSTRDILLDKKKFSIENLPKKWQPLLQDALDNRQPEMNLEVEDEPLLE
ncbi:MAG: hypothetical protein AB8G11_22025 [Saprospiraceae bacterium]